MVRAADAGLAGPGSAAARADPARSSGIRLARAVTAGRGGNYINGIRQAPAPYPCHVTPPVPEVSLDELARLHVVRGGQLMWLIGAGMFFDGFDIYIGAGASAAAGVPTAGQMIDEFRQLIYATVHGVPLAALSLAEPAIRDRIERFFAGHPDYPAPGDPAEFSALFEAAWNAPADRRAYLEGKLVVGKPAFGNFGLAVLAALGRAPVGWTPNFDRG